MNISKPKIAIFSDLHLGKHNNSAAWHKVALDWCDWFIDELRSQRIKDVIFMGDWHDNRSEISVHTLDVSAALIDKFKDFNLFMIIGNHDIPYKNNSAISSVSVYGGRDNVKIYDKLDVIEGFDRKLGIVPWGADISSLPRVDAILGHLEIESFKMNAVKTCDHGIKPADLLEKSSLIFSGHFHIRNSKVYKQGSIIYVGNPFQMDYGDQHDEKGFTVLDLENMSFTWYDNNVSPVHYTLKLSEIIKLGIKPYATRCVGNIIKLNVDVAYPSSDTAKLFEYICSLKPMAFNPDYTYIANISTGEANTDQITSIDIRGSINEYLDIVDVYGKEQVREYMLELYDKSR